MRGPLNVKLIKKIYLVNYVASFVSGQRWRPWLSHTSRGS